MGIVYTYFSRQSSIAPLITFRILFGFLMVCSISRFALKGWIEQLYIAPVYYFTYLGFDWVKPVSAEGMYIVFLLMGLCALGIMIGAFYRMSAIVFFILFTYVELIDKTNYLNHYYFVSLISFILIWLPANRYFSVDYWINPSLKRTQIPVWSIHILMFQMGVLYFFAGLAKLNYDWMVNALPLAMWLPSVSDTPMIGPLLERRWVAYVFSWFGAIYDLTIVFFLLCKGTRLWAYITVVAFHFLTAVLFPIGVFPWVMIVATLIFFPSNVHENILGLFGQQFNRKNITEVYKPNSLMISLIGIYMAVQVLIPLRYLIYPGNLFWHEQGYRFSWRVMLMEKAGYTTFRVEDKDSQKKEWVDNYKYLNRQQEKMMSTQPDMILQFAHYLGEKYKEKGFVDPAVFCDSKVTLNGRKSQLFINPTIDLMEQKRGLGPKSWIVPLSEKNQRNND